MRLQVLAAQGRQVDEVRYGQAKQLIDSELRISPMDTGAWLKLAALEARDGRLNEAALKALTASYRFTPVDAVMARWRLAFMFEHWTELNAPLRAATQREIEDLMTAQANAEILREVCATVHDPSGRLPCYLLIERFSRT